LLIGNPTSLLASARFDTPGADRDQSRNRKSAIKNSSEAQFVLAL
jgi:hypothetical protein